MSYDAKGAVLEGIDVHVFLEHVDPDWRDHYSYDKDIAFEQMTQHMDKAEIINAIKDSGCME